MPAHRWRWEISGARSCMHQEDGLKHHSETSWSMDTRLVHGSRNDIVSGTSGSPTVEPLYLSTTYLYDDVDALDQAFSGKSSTGEAAYVYSLQGNPNAQSLETQLAEIEGGAGAIVFGSGMAAIHAALLSAGLAPGAKILV